MNYMQRTSNDPRSGLSRSFMPDLDMCPSMHACSEVYNRYVLPCPLHKSYLHIGKEWYYITTKEFAKYLCCIANGFANILCYIASGFANILCCIANRWVCKYIMLHFRWVSVLSLDQSPTMGPKSALSTAL